MFASGKTWPSRIRMRVVGLVLLALVAASCAKSMPSVHVKQGAASQGVSLQVITMSEKNQPTWMLVNSSTGELSCAGTMVFPTTDTGCSWSLGTGRRGERYIYFIGWRPDKINKKKHKEIDRLFALLSAPPCSTRTGPGCSWARRFATTRSRWSFFCFWE